MKRIWLLWILLLVIFVAGCGKEKEVRTKAEINVESCNTYFELINCIIDNDPDNSYSLEDREVVREAINERRNDWASLDDNTLDQMCSAELNNLLSTVWNDSLIEIGCSID